MGLGGLVLGFPILYFKGMRLLMFQLSGFHCRVSGGPLCRDHLSKHLGNSLNQGPVWRVLFVPVPYYGGDLKGSLI